MSLSETQRIKKRKFAKSIVGLLVALQLPFMASNMYLASADTLNCNNLAGNIVDPNSAATISKNNNILNSDFEYGVSGYGVWPGLGDVPWNFIDPYADSATANYEWMTSDREHELEIWHVEKNESGLSDFKSGDYVENISGMEPYSGKNWAELGANSEGVLYQDVATIPGTTFTYSFAHHGREITDTMKLSIGAKPANVATPSHGAFGPETNESVMNGLTQQTPSLKAIRQNKSDTTGSGVFRRYSGPADLSDNVGDKWGVYRGTYVVPEGQTCTRFAFSYVSGLSPSIGNFLDGVKFSRAIDDEFENYTTNQELNLLSNDNNLTSISNLLDSDLQPLQRDETDTTKFVTALGGLISITSPNTVHYTQPLGVNNGTDTFSYLASDDFNAQMNCGPNCLQTNSNAWLDKFTRGEVAFPTTPAPPQMGFL